jgi:putative ABC transport system ATP-binding protein
MTTSDQRDRTPVRADTSRTALRLEGVRTRWGVAASVTVDLAVDAGDRLLIRGRSGTGKTALLYVMGLLDPPAAGRVSVCGREVRRERDAARVRGDAIAYVFQEALMIDHLSVERNLRLAVGGPGLPAALQTLDAWDVPWRGRHPAALSPGERQRAMVAAALARRAPLVLADEPTSNLDGASRRLVTQAFAELPDESAVVVVSHDPGWESWATRVLDLEELAA